MHRLYHLLDLLSWLLQGRLLWHLCPSYVTVYCLVNANVVLHWRSHALSIVRYLDVMFSFNLFVANYHLLDLTNSLAVLRRTCHINCTVLPDQNLL